jgi:UDP-sugar pyrophosphorylase
MQDLPKSFVSGEKVGVTIFDRVWCFSACKNNLVDAAAKVATNGPAESASSAENDFYLAGRMKLRAAGMEVLEAPQKNLSGIPLVPGPRVILRPSFALTLADVRARIIGGSISGEATLVLDGDLTLENVTIADGASLVAKAPKGGTLEIKDRTVTRSGAVHDLVPLTDAEMTSSDVPEYLRIRGYRIVAREA